MNTHNSSPLENFFLKTSKGLIWFPIIALVIIFLMKSQEQKPVTTYSQHITPTISLMPTLKQTAFESVLATPKVSTKEAISLTGPYKCMYSDKETSIVTYIKNKNIYVEITKDKALEKVLINGDCLYHWNGSVRTGEKMCGISQYISLIEGLSQSGLLSIDDLFTSISQEKSDIGVNSSNAKSLAQSCEKHIIADSMFVVPRNIIFKDSAAISPTKK
jgi:hypothetical protein